MYNRAFRSEALGGVRTSIGGGVDDIGRYVAGHASRFGHRMRSGEFEVLRCGNDYSVLECNDESVHPPIPSVVFAVVLMFVCGIGRKEEMIRVTHVAKTPIFRTVNGKFIP